MKKDAEDLQTGYDISPTEQDEYILKMFQDEDFAIKCRRHGLVPELFAGRPRQATVREIYRNLNSYSTVGNLSIDNMRILLRKRNIPDKQKGEINAFMTTLETDPALKLSSNGYYEERLDQFVTHRTVRLAQDLLLTAPPEANPGMLIDDIRSILDDYGRAKIPSSGTRLRTAKIAELPPVIARFNIPALDKALGIGDDRGGLREGDLCMILGFTGTGKSWCMVHLAKHALIRGESVLLLSTELGRAPIIFRMAQSFHGLTRQQVQEQRYTLIRSNQWKSHFGKHSELMIYGLDEWALGVDGLDVLWQENCDKIGRKIGLVLIDSADELSPPEYAGRMVKQYDRQGATYEVLRNFAEKNKVAVATTAQANRRGGDAFWLNSKLVADSHKKSMKAQVGISINGTEAEIAAGYVRFWLWKYTHGETGRRVWCRHKYDIGQLHAQSDYYNKDEYDKILESIMAQDGGVS